MRRSPTPYQQHLAEQAKLDRLVHPTYWVDWIAVTAVLLVVIVVGAWTSQKVVSWATQSPTARLVMATVK